MAVQIGAGNLGKHGAVVEASDGTKIAVFHTAASGICVYKDIDGTPSLVDSDTDQAVFGDVGSLFIWCHAAIDSNDDIHVVAIAGADQTRDVAYCICDLTTGFGTWEEAAAYTGLPTYYKHGQISLDSNDKPWIIYTDAVGGYDQIYIVEKTGASWSSPEQVSSNSALDYTSPRLCHCPNNDIEAIYCEHSGKDVAYRRRNGSWGTENEYAKKIHRLYSIATVTCTTGDAVYRTYADEPSAVVDNIEENGSDTGYDTDDVYLRTSAVLVGTGRYIFYIDTNEDIHVISNDGTGWTDESAQQTGTYEYVVAEWAYNNENQSGEINYIFDDGTNIYYGSFSLGGVVKEMQGTSDGVAAADAILKAILQLIATSDGMANVPNVNIKRTRPLIATSGGIAGVSSLLEIVKLLIGTADGTAAVTSLLRRIKMLAGISDGVSTTTSVLHYIAELQATSDGITTTSSVLYPFRGLIGTSDGIATADSILRYIAALNATSGGQATTISDLTVLGTVWLQGTSDGIATVSSLLTGTWYLHGISDGLSTVDAALYPLRGLTGTSDGATTAGGTLTGVWLLHGTSDGIATVLGGLTLEGLILLVGSSAGTSTADAILKYTAALTGTSGGEATTISMLHLLRGLIGTSDGVATANATFHPIRWLQATSTGIAIVDGKLVAIIPLVATSDGAAIVTTDLSVVRALFGSSVGIADVTSVLQLLVDEYWSKGDLKNIGWGGTFHRISGLRGDLGYE